MNDYLKSYYASKRRPETGYPLKLAAQLSREFGLSRGERILDVGCGTGQMVKAFHSIGFEVEGADAVESAKEFCSPHRVHIVNIEHEQIDIPEESFDIVFSKSVVEHLRDPLALIRESRRVLKPGGKLILLTPSWVHMGWGPFYQDHTHVTPFTSYSLETLLELGELLVTEVRHFRQLPLLWRFPFLTPISKLISTLPIPYWPQHNVRYWEDLNKFVRFSNEVMLLAVAQKPYS